MKLETLKLGALKLETLKQFFVRDGRLRSGWRVTLYLVASFVAMIVGSLLVGVVVGAAFAFALANQGVTPAEIGARIAAMFGNLFEHPLLALSVEGGRVLFGLALIWLFRRFIDKRPFRALGFQMTNGWWKEFGAGFALAVGVWAVIFALAMATGAATIVDVAWNARDALGIIGMLAVGLAFNVLVGIIEETDARGYVLQNLAEGIRFVPAVVVSSAYFAILHRLNVGAGWGSTAGIFVAGILLAMGYAVTRRLWFSIGMHAAWNFAEGPVFGFLVSGYNMGGLVKLNVAGPEWLMGGAFGPEAGALAVGVEVTVIAALVVWARKKNGTQSTADERR